MYIYIYAIYAWNIVCENKKIINDIQNYINIKSRLSTNETRSIEKDIESIKILNQSVWNFCVKKGGTLYLMLSIDHPTAK